MQKCKSNSEKRERKERERQKERKKERQAERKATTSDACQKGLYVQPFCCGKGSLVAAPRVMRRAAAGRHGGAPSSVGYTSV